MAALYVLVNDSLVPADQASLLISDLSIQRGYGIFDFFKTLDGRVIFWDEHMDRFFHSAARLRLDIGRSREALRESIRLLMQKNGIPDSGIRLTLTGGYSRDGYTLAQPNLIITQTALPAPITRDLPDSIEVVTYAHQRQMPEVKTIDYLMGVWLQPYIREKGAQDVLYHRDGVVTECPRSNFFVVTADDTIVTPTRNILKGITRMKLLEVAGKQFKVEQRDLLLEELDKAKEAFITSTTKHVLPVTAIDGRAVGTGKAGEVSAWLQQALYTLVQAQG